MDRMFILLLVSLSFFSIAYADDTDVYLNAQTSSSGIEVLGLTSAFVAASAPMNNYNKTQSLDDLFLAVFEANSTERWNGNIKKLALKDVRGNGFAEMLDVNNLALASVGNTYRTAVTHADSCIEQSALTFWSDPNTFPIANLENNEVQGKDGRSVKRGGAGQKIPQFVDGFINYNNGVGTRQIYTENKALNALIPFNPTDVNALEFYPLMKIGIEGRPSLNWLLNTAQIPTTFTLVEQQKQVAKAVMHYARGVDIANSAYDYMASSGPARGWLLGDVIHSKPLALNYGNIPGWPDPLNPYVSVIFGANDGMLHFLENTDGSGVETGVERYAFLPRELFNILPVLVSNMGTFDNPYSNNKHPYGMDGQVTSLVFDDTTKANNNLYTVDVGVRGVNDFAYIYSGMRRGGKTYYALDVTDPLNPPVYLGKITKGLVPSDDFYELGLTFSNAVPALVKFNENVTPVLIFAGGYTTAKDDKQNLNAKGVLVDPNNAGRKDDTGYYDNTHGATRDIEGNAIYVVNALTLDLLWKSTNNASFGRTNNHYPQPGLNYAIPSTVTTLDTNFDGYMDRVYVGDIAGNVWRGDFPACGATLLCSDKNHRKKHWTMKKFAALGNATAAGDTRFFHPPVVVYTYDEFTGSPKYDAVVLTSGDRENPLEITDNNRIYMLKDRSIHSGVPPTKPLLLDDLADVTDCIIGNEITVKGDCSGSLFTSESLKHGWRIDLNTIKRDGVKVKGEKGLSTPIVVDGKIFLTTFIPSVSMPESCTLAEGVSNLYLLDLKDGTAANNNDTRYVELAAGIVGDVIVAGQTIVLPGAASVDFLMDVKDAEKYKKAADNDEVLSLPAGVAGTQFIYWRDNDVNDTK
jgi:type IV pilus assembly protein PilY1